MASQRGAGYRKFVKTYRLGNISAACLRECTEDVESALKECEDPANVADDTGWSPIHFACRKDHEEIVGLLLNSGFSPLVRTPEGNTPLHIASRNGCGNVVRRLLEVDIAQDLLEGKNKEGNTPLHLACEAGQLEVVQKLVERTNRKQILSWSNGVGKTPLGLAIQHSQWEMAGLIMKCSSCTNPALIFDDFTQHVPARSMLHSLDHESLHVIVMGDANTGKSTLIKSLQMQGIISQLVNSLFGVRNADQHKVGIVPSIAEYTIQNSKHQVIFHELTGHRDYTHEMIFECTNKPLDSLFIVTVDMRCSDDAIEESISYWLKFLWQKCIKLGLDTGNSERRPNILVVGSFADQAGQRLRRPNPHERLNLICIEGKSEGIYSHFGWLGNYTFDCQRPMSWAINQLRSVLEDKCQQLQQKEHPTQPGCYILATLLETEFANTPAIAFDHLWTHIMNSESPICKLLPQNTEELLQLCKGLHDNSYIVVLPQSHSSNSSQVWIVQNYREVVSDVHDILFESDLRNAAHNGIVTPHSIKAAVPPQSQYPPNFIIQFLDHFNFCKRFDAQCLQESARASRHNPIPQHSKSVPAMSNSPQSSPLPHRTFSQPSMPSPVTRGLFFPCFVPQSTPEPWETDEHYTYSFSWVSMPSEDQECPFFMPGFVTRLFVHLIQKFAPSPLHLSSPIERQCTVWSQGVRWSDAEGMDICVAVHNNKAVILSMRCLRAKEMPCLLLRNKVIHDIQYLQKEMHLDIKTNEYIAGGDTLPVTDPNKIQALYSMGRIVQAIKEGQSVVLDKKGCNPKELDALLYFEPYVILSDPLQKWLCDPEKANDRLSDDFCIQFAQQLGSKWIDLAHYFGLPQSHVSELQEDNRAPHRTAMDLLQSLRDGRDDSRIQTYDELHRSLECISILKSSDIIFECS